MEVKVMKKRIFVLLMSLAMVMTMMPLSVFAGSENLPGKVITAADLKEGDVIKARVEKADVNDPQAVDENGEINFVVAHDQATTGTNDGIFCVSQKVLNIGKFAENNSDYLSSDIRTWCHELYNCFNGVFQSSIMATSKSEEAHNYNIEYPEGRSIGELQVEPNQITEEFFLKSFS